MARSTRESIVTAAAELMRRKGYAGVSMKDLAEAAGAPIGSLYHHFRGGKVQIAREALTNAGLAYGLLIPTVVDGYTDLGAAIDGVFTQAARDMADTGFANMCPVVSVAGEVADTVEELRSATRDIFTAWIDGGAAYFTSRGLDEPLARQVTTALIAGLEGAFLLARAIRDTAPLLATGATMAPQYRGIALAPRVGVDAR
ncbi:putative transcriptional regulator, TetR family protein [Mycolicibacterium parafortuitum]|uniref:Putative transcriptional regulator, TetR family protein n=1 Tax=Mycolicibacterium parafortuitum TaxID=39692 RepID=A0A7I7U8L2_MYCPF|nr:TetR/AcrR family transcriptional regulator [Mycolicibacterium parafortuitum]BBY77742.1 putative transcriptional regulator, TetR family protein [Mycolicibacterium parafortuitum]